MYKTQLLGSILLQGIRSLSSTLSTTYTVALQEVCPHQVFLLQGFLRPGEHFQTQTGHRTSTNPNSLELSSENIYITTTTTKMKKKVTVPNQPARKLC